MAFDGAAVQISWLGFVLPAGLPNFAVSGLDGGSHVVKSASLQYGTPVAFVTLTVAGRRELFTPLP